MQRLPIVEGLVAVHDGRIRRREQPNAQQDHEGHRPARVSVDHVALQVSGGMADERDLVGRAAAKSRRRAILWGGLMMVLIN